MTEYMEAGGGVVDVGTAPQHVVHLWQQGDRHRAVCSCNQYQSKWVRDRSYAHRLGRAHATYHLRKWREVL